MDPLVGIYSAATRAGLDGRRLPGRPVNGLVSTGPWRPIRYTAPGRGTPRDKRGVIASGALADLAVWSADLYEYSERYPAALLDSVPT